MTVFFLLVGLEIRREMTVGHFRRVRAAMLPVAAAVGGMITPALVYLAIAGATEPRGWAIPMATDIALGDRCRGRARRPRARVGESAAARPGRGRRRRGDRRDRHLLLVGGRAGWLAVAAGCVLLTIVLRRPRPPVGQGPMSSSVSCCGSRCTRPVSTRPWPAWPWACLPPPCRCGRPSSSTPTSSSTCPTSATPGRPPRWPVARSPWSPGSSTSCTRGAATSSCPSSPSPTWASS